MDPKRYAPATQRNRQVILEILQQNLPSTGNVLEIASGTGEHAVFFAANLPHLHWYPSDRDPDLRASIKAWSKEYPSPNLHPPLSIDVTIQPWQAEIEQIAINAIANINMIHISPWSACLSLMAGAGRILPPGGVLYLYGPYQKAGKHTAPSNEAFDRSLRDRNAEWGIRNLEDVITAAADNQLTFQEAIAMPANNFSVIFTKTS